MRTVLITGASSGIGKSTAEHFLAAGDRVYVAARRIDRMQDLAEKGAVPLALDVTKDDDLVTAVQRIESEAGAIDVLVNNAGFGMYGAMEDTTIDDARYQFEVNLFGLARLTQLALPAMRKQRSARIINVSSIGGKIYTPLGSWYHATKHALEGWSDCLRIELAPFDIDVVIIEPGLIRTEFDRVVAGPMLERSGGTAYAPMTNSLMESMTKSYENPKGASPPSVIADVIFEAANAKRPKTRYAKGKMAGTVLFMRRWLSDRAFDRAILSRM